MTAISRTSGRVLHGRILGPMLAAVVAMFVLAACDESTGPQTEDQEAAAALAAEGFQILSSVIMADTLDAAQIQQVEAAKAKFEDALALDASNPDANVGLAICEIILAGTHPDVLAAIGAGVPPGIFGKALPPEKKGFYRALGAPSGGDQMLSAAGTLNWFKGVFAKPAQQQPPDLSAIQDVAEQIILPALEIVTTALAVVEAVPDWQLVLTAQMTGMAEVRLEIDVTDVLMLDAMTRTLKAQIHAFVSYTMDMPQNPADTTAVKAAFNQTDGTFLKIRQNGITNLGNARTELLAAIQKVRDFKVSLLAETDDQSDDLIVVDPTGMDGPTVTELTDLEADLDELEAALSLAVPVTADFDGNGIEETMNVDLSKLFTNPITDWKQMLPPYAWDSTLMMFIWNGYMTADFSQFIWPDPTFHDVFPDVTDFNVTFGIVYFPSPGPFFMGPGGY